MIKISIIVPIYNAEEHLEKCIDSILRQTEKDMEVILVDDGSKDNSGVLCDEYRIIDNRVRVIHQKNAGVSAARNAGIDSALGEYIGFVDSDDWVEPTMFERLLSEANKYDADVVMCDATTVYSNGKTQADTIMQLSESTILKKAEFTPALLLEMAGSACRCIYKKHIYNDKLMKSERLHFPLGVKFSEDRIFNIRAFGYANKVVYLKEAYYNRYINMESTVYRFHTDYFDAYKIAARVTETAIKDAWNDDETYQKKYLSHFIMGAFGAINNYYYKTSTLTKEEKRDAVKSLCKDEQLRAAIIKYGVDRKSRWILKENYTALIVYAKLTNWKNRR